MGKVALARRYPSRLDKKRKTRLEKKRKARLEKKRKKDEKRKKQALAEYEYKEKRKEQEERRKEQERRRLYFVKKEDSYWRRVWKSDGFDVDGLTYPGFGGGMRVFKCEKPNDCLLIVSLYARIGLHRYNMTQGTNLKLHRIEKYNIESVMVATPASYYITLVAEDPATGSLVPFQTSSHERTRHKMDVRFYVARPQNSGTKGRDDETAPQFCNISVPKWPSEEAIADKKQFYVVQESELKENDWIRLYLELGFVTTNRRIPNPKLCDLKIVEVMVETEEKVQPPNAKLKGFRDATVYIKYHQDLGEGRVCKRRAIVRRSVDLRTERMSLKGDDYLES